MGENLGVVDDLSAERNPMGLDTLRPDAQRLQVPAFRTLRLPHAKPTRDDA